MPVSDTSSGDHAAVCWVWNHDIPVMTRRNSSHWPGGIPVPVLRLVPGTPSSVGTDVVFHPPVILRSWACKVTWGMESPLGSVGLSNEFTPKVTRMVISINYFKTSLQFFQNKTFLLTANEHSHLDKLQLHIVFHIDSCMYSCVGVCKSMLWCLSKLLLWFICEAKLLTEYRAHWFQ